jgi:hypothetical protein
LYRLLNDGILSSAGPGFFDQEQLLETDIVLERSVTDKLEHVYPIEETVKNMLLGSLVKDIPMVTLHYGGRNQELLRNAGALALTKGTDIYIREEAYVEGTTLTDAILIHELTHVKQFQNNVRLSTKDEVEAAEKEAEAAESSAEAVDGSYYIELEGEMYYVNKEIAAEAIEYALQLLYRSLREAIRREDIRLLQNIQTALQRLA